MEEIDLLLGFQEQSCMAVSMSGAGKTEHIPLQVSSKITGGEVRGHEEAWTWTTHPDFKSTKEQRAL